MNPPKILLEACVDSLDSALAAEAGGADRIELCAALELGGITPSPGLVSLACERLQIPVQVLLRPRGGNFCYTPAEFEVMCADARRLAESGAAGIVTGVLGVHDRLEVSGMEVLMEASWPLPVTFHRAFDRVVEPRETVEALVQLGVERILSSGQAASAVSGAKLLGELQRDFGQRITIMPGGGITPENLAEVIERTACREFHFSVLKEVRYPGAGPRLGKGKEEGRHFVPDGEKMAAMRILADHFAAGK